MRTSDRSSGRHCGIAAAALIVAFLLFLLATARLAREARAAGGAAASAAGGASAPGDARGAPRIDSILKPSVKDRMQKDRDVVVYASLEDTEPQAAHGPHVREPSRRTSEDALKRYWFYAGMQVRSPLERTRKILTDYELYARMIPYIDHARYSAETRVLDIQGGVLGFVLRSQVRFDELGPGWIRYRIVGGHFQGLAGDILFEAGEARATSVLMRGELSGTRWPPKFIIERGAEIVFGFTARRMRSYIESEPEKAPAQGGAKHGSPEEIPQPRSRL